MFAYTYSQLPLVHWDSWVCLLEIMVRKNDIILQHQYRFDDSSNSTRALSMANVRFDGAYAKYCLSLLISSERGS